MLAFLVVFLFVTPAAQNDYIIGMFKAKPIIGQVMNVKGLIII